MDWLETKYIGIVSHRLRNFKRKGPNLYNFSCVLCGDSESDPRKARAYFYEKEGKSAFYCHKCGASSTVMNLIKKIDLNLYEDYQLERLQNNKSIEQIKFDDFVDKMKKPAFLKSGPLKSLKKISQLSSDHPMKQFVTKRMIPNPYHAKLFLCPNFLHYVNGLIPGKFSQ
jgi:transcription elongation factor Elf1